MGPIDVKEQKPWTVIRGNEPGIIPDYCEPGRKKKKEAIVSILSASVYAVLLVFVFPSGGHHKYNR